MNLPYLLLGLGNPGKQYARTRHNAGWLVLDSILQLWQETAVRPAWKTEKKIQGEVCRFSFGRWNMAAIKPNTFMNESGLTAAAAAKWYLHIDPTKEDDLEFANLVVLHDDLDLPLGKYKLQYNSGPQIHNGVNSVRSHLHSTRFWVARIGIDSREGNRDIPGQAYVLQTLSSEEQQSLKTLAADLAEELRYVVLQ